MSSAPSHLKTNVAIVVASMLFLAANVAHCDEVAALQYDPPKEICKLENRKVNESSGLAVSRRNADFFWTHNDSGDRSKLYCFDIKGNHRGTCQVKKSEAIDWEDMCSYTRDGKPRLLVGDIGDNGSRRKSVRLYLLEEPDDPSNEVKPIQTIKLKYSTGPMDCEALAVDTVSRKILLVEKRRWLTCRVFIADLPDEADDEKVTAEPIAQIKLPLVTGMDVSSDGKRAIVLTLGQAFEYTRGEGEDWAAAFKRKPRTIDMPARKQGEAICYGAEGNDLYLTSEFSPCPLFLVKAAKPPKAK